MTTEPLPAERDPATRSTPSVIRPDDVERLAKLARIALTADEVAATGEQLTRIFTLIETMLAVDTTGVEPLTTPLAAIADVALRLRDDAVTETDHRDAFQAPAPSVEGGLYLVPKVIE